MIKKLFALASVTALTGLVATTGSVGCSSTTTTSNSSSGSTGDASADASKPGKSSSGSAVTEEDAAAEPTSCAVQQPIDVKDVPYTKALRQPGACTLEEEKALDAYIKGLAAGADVVLADWQKTVSAKCASCVFTADDAASWGALLYDKDSKLSNVNEGSCFEIASGNVECGKTWQQYNICMLNACSDKQCPTDEDKQACYQDQAVVDQGGACGDAFSALVTACGKNLATYAKTCQYGTYIFDAAVHFQCVVGAEAGDGG